MSDFKMELPRDVLYIIDRLNGHGFSAHIVGGSVRDSIIGRSLGDFDITTSALPNQTKAVFADCKTVDTGIKHGTVTLVLNHVPYEITTYRVDGDYKESRHPEEVIFTADLCEDLARRDFTVNAMAYSPDGGLVDPFEGRIDAEHRIIRAVGDAHTRFSEDALRILRALRFASVLGFEIEARTALAIRELAHTLSAISKERIYTELKKLLMGVDAVRILTDYSSVFEIILGGLTVGKLPDKERFDCSDYYSRLAAIFLLNSSDPYVAAEKTLVDLKTDKHTRSYVSSIIRAYESTSLESVRDVLRTLSKEGEEIVGGVLSLGILMGRFSDVEKCNLERALSCGIPYKISALAVRGNDLSDLGIRGERIGETLIELLSAVIDGKVENKKDDLISYLRPNI